MVASPPRDIPFFQANRGGVPEDFLMSGGAVGDYIYYRQPNGWLTMGHVGKNNIQLHKYQDEGWTPLREYGRFDFPIPYYVDHPFEVLFLRGGAGEMSLEQIRALGYDKTPPRLPRCNLALGKEHVGPTGRPLHFERCWLGAQVVVFPQLDGVEPLVVPACEFCERDDFTSVRAREQHMRVLHIEELREIKAAREMAAGMRDAVIAGVQGLASVQGQPVMGLPIAGMAARPFGCGLCGESFEKMRGADGLEAHVKLHDDGGDDGA